MRALVVLLVVVAGCAVSVPSKPPPSPPGTSAPPPSAPPRAEPEVPRRASGRYEVVPGGAMARRGRGKVIRYLVEVERGLPFGTRAFAAEVHRTLNDPRGWGRFRRVDGPPVRLRVALSSPRLTDRECVPLRTSGDLSCWNGSRSVINARRWAEGVPQYGGDLAAYRRYLINHEVGHALGHRHARCPRRGRLAPVMAQQSKSLHGCRPNPWPHPERGREER
ncbi:DUF3152 domain-containing protein [Nonomuraea sp. C10]|uniref:DUF3152 domain-containing protein n=1 Tax=Nonomuraea sp. C10 TaxID=2600577 RepID=UPI0021C2FB62|nr:DUF3152 domain-containing protein [Nonomuraea sp. C10]